MDRLRKLAPAPSTLLGQVALAALALLALELIYVLADGETVLGAGLVNEVPLRHVVVEQWREGIVPIWSSAFGTGQPLLADSASLPLDPRNALLLPFSALDGYLVAAILTRVVAGAITFAYLRRRLGASGFPAFVGTVLFLSTTVLFEEGTALANGIVAFPALVWLSERLMETVTAPRMLALAAAWGLFMFMHSVGYVPYLMGGAFAWCLLLALFGGRDRRAVVRFSGAFAIAAALGAGLAAVNLLPSAELASESNRGGEYPTDPYALNSLISAVFGANRPSGVFPLSTYFFYVGIVSFAPILVAIRRWSDPYVRAAVAFGLSTAAILLFGFVAKPVLVDVVPALESVAFFRPAFLIGFAAAVLVTHGLTAPNWELGRRARQALGLLFVVQASLLVTAAVLAAYLLSTRLEAESTYDPLNSLLTALSPGILPLLLIGLRAAGLGIALVWPSQGPRLTLGRVALRRNVAVGLVLVAELALAWAIARPQPLVGYGDSPELSFLAERTGDDLRAFGITPRPTWTDELPGPDDLSLHTNVPAYSGIATPNVYASLISSDYSDTFDDFGDTAFRDSLFERAPNSRMETSRYDSPLLRAFGVGYLYSTSDFPDPTRRTLALTGDGHYVYALEDPLPRAFFAGRGRWLPDDDVHRELQDLAAGRIGATELGPEVLLDGAARTEGTPAYRPARVTSDRGSEIDVSVDAPSAGFLVLSDVNLPGWSAKVDDRPTEIHEANGFAKAVRVPPGTHTVSFEYSPDGVRNGVRISVITAFLCVAILLGSVFGPRLRRRLVRPATSAPARTEPGPDQP